MKFRDMKQYSRYYKITIVHLGLSQSSNLQQLPYPSHFLPDHDHYEMTGYCQAQV